MFRLTEKLSGIEGVMDSQKSIEIERLEQLEAKVTLLEAKLQASADLTDDLLSASSNAISVVSSNATQVIDTATIVMAKTDIILIVFVTGFTILATAVSWFVTHRLNKKRESHMQDAVRDFNSKLSKNKEFRESFMAQLANQPNIVENLNLAMQKIAEEAGDSDQFDDIRESIS